MVDPMTGYDDEQDRVEREDERIREERWNQFVKEMKSQSFSMNLYQVKVAYDTQAGPDEISQTFIDFAETEGWDGVLNAIARAYREEQQKERQ